MNDLDQLAGMAAESDLGAKALDPVDPNAPPPPPVLNYQTEARGMVDMFAAFATGYAPKCAPIWDEETKARISIATAPVMEKYGFTLGNIPPELILVGVAGPVLYQTSKVIAQQINDDKARAEAKAKENAPQSSIATTASPELAVSPQTALYPG